MRIFSILAMIWGTAAFADPVVLEGAVGPYQIEAELSLDGDEIVGRYRYEGRDVWLDLTGQAFAQDAIELIEQVDGETTGAFYLGAGDGALSGFWAHEGRDFPASLTPARGALSDLLAPIETHEIGRGLTGRYFTGSYWVNDLFAPNYEIGFNGGDANVVQVAPNLILVGFNFVVGPTYHFATFQGFASKIDDQTYVHDAILDGGEEPCRLVFRFHDDTLEIEDSNNGFACQFGMRAHANFNLLKVSNTAEFNDPW